MSSNSESGFAIHSPLMKPVLGSIWSPNRVRAEVEQLYPALLHAKGIFLFLLPYPDGSEAIAQQVLMTLQSKLWSESLSATLFSPNTSSPLPASIEQYDFLLGHNLPVYLQLLETILFDSIRRNVIVVATIPLSMSDSVSFSVPSQVLTVRFDVSDEAYDDEMERLQARFPHSEDSLNLIAVADAADTSLPVELVARAAGTTAEEVIQVVKSNDLFRVFEVGENLQVSTASSILARRFLGLDSAVIEKCLVRLLEAVDLNSGNERLCIVNLFQSVLALTSRQFGNTEVLFNRSAIKKLLEGSDDSIRSIAWAGSEIECVLWGKIFESVGLFQHAEGIIETVEVRFPENLRIKHAIARLLLEWSVFDPEKREIADDRLNKLMDLDPENPYIRHSAAVSMLRRGDASKAVYLLNKAVELGESHGGTESDIFFISSLAEALMDLGKYDKAETVLNDCPSSEFSIYLLHAKAKLKYYEGNYDDARVNLGKLFEIRPNSIEGHTMLGEMFARRGHWNSAAAQLEKSLEIDPENVHVLRALADMESDRGDHSRISGDPNGGEACYVKARAYIDQALAIEPENIWLLTAQASILRRTANNEELRPLIERFRRLRNKFGAIDKTRQYIESTLGELYLRCDRLNDIDDMVNRIPTNTRSLPIKLLKLKTVLRRNIWTDAYTEELNELEWDVDPARPAHERIRSYLSIADIWLGVNRAEESLRLADLALEIDSESVFAVAKKAAALRALEKTSDAKKEAERAEELSRR